MHPGAVDVGAQEWLANLSIGYIVLAAFVLTCLRLVLTPSRSGFARSIAELSESLIIAGILVFLLIRPYVVQAFYIPSQSMEPTLMGHEAGQDCLDKTCTDTIHDQLFVNKFVYRFGEPRHGDIIVFRAPAEADPVPPPEENVLIKRLVGLPGDTLEVKEDDAGVVRLYRNGQALNEPYIAEPMRNPREMFNPGGPLLAVDSPLKLGPNELFVMGDNRNNSNDSRFWGVLERRRVIGKAWFVFLPLNRIRVIR